MAQIDWSSHLRREVEYFAELTKQKYLFFWGQILQAVIGLRQYSLWFIIKLCYPSIIWTSSLARAAKKVIGASPLKDI